MEHLQLMIVLTSILAVLGILTWHKTHNLAFPLGIFMLYYWSLHGAWAIITDKRGGISGTHYYYLEHKMFALQLDDCYYWSLALYGLFIIAVALTVLILAKPADRHSAAAHSPLVFSHTVVILMAVFAALLSFIIIFPSLQTALTMNVSAYSFKAGDRADLPPLFTLYQTLNRVALLGSAIGLAVILSGKNPKYLTGQSEKWTAPCYLAILAIMGVQAVLMGDKAQIVFTGLSAVLFYLVNTERPQYAALGALTVAGFLGLAAMDMLRGVPLPLLMKAVMTTSPAEWADTAQSFSNSDEAFGAHFSMYGALSCHLEPTFGSSLTSLAASIIPRAYWEDRPDDIYTYYADGVHAAPGQGYSIHHATGWYLNFGVAGIVIGAVLLGLIWSACYNRFLRIPDRAPSWMKICAIIAPWTFTANLPMLIRAGQEGYKGVFIDVFVIPTVVFWIASQDWRAVLARYRSGVPEIAATQKG